MVWLWFIAGSIAGVTLGIMITCAIVINRDIDDWEERK